MAVFLLTTIKALTATDPFGTWLVPVHFCFLYIHAFTQFSTNKYLYQSEKKKTQIRRKLSSERSCSLCYWDKPYHARVSPIHQDQGRLEADETLGPWSQKKEVKKSVLNFVFDNMFLLIAIVLSCNEGALSPAFLYTSIFHAQLCFTSWAASWNRDLGYGGCYNTI